MSSPLLFPARLFSVEFEGGWLYWSCYFTHERIYFHRQWRDDDLLEQLLQRRAILQATAFSTLYPSWSRKDGFPDEFWIKS